MLKLHFSFISINWSVGGSWTTCSAYMCEPSSKKAWNVSPKRILNGFLIWSTKLYPEMRKQINNFSLSTLFSDYEAKCKKSRLERIFAIISCPDVGTNNRKGSEILISPLPVIIFLNAYLRISLRTPLFDSIISLSISSRSPLLFFWNFWRMLFAYMCFY